METNAAAPPVTLEEQIAFVHACIDSEAKWLDSNALSSSGRERATDNLFSYRAILATLRALQAGGFGSSK